jgi:heme-degrading monooxygenase HmoA
MTYAFTYDVPITTEIYGRIMEGLGPERPPGLISHLTLQIENGLRYIDVWQSKDDFEAFAESRLHPVVHPILEDTLGFIPPEPGHTTLDVVHVWTNRYPD